jgi:hypothetical protein
MASPCTSYLCGSYGRLCIVASHLPHTGLLSGPGASQLASQLNYRCCVRPKARNEAEGKSE